MPDGLNATEQENGAWAWRLRCGGQNFEYEKLLCEFGLQEVYGVREGMGFFRGEDDRVCLMEAMGMAVREGEDRAKITFT